MAASRSNADDSTAGIAKPDSQAENLHTPETLISNTIATLRNAKGTDVALLAILAGHILTMNPAAEAISDAVTAIEALAAKRAQGSDNDNADQD